MQITLHPMRHDQVLSVERLGAALVLNGAQVELPAYLPGGSPWIIGQPAQVEGQWQVDLILPHGAEAPPETLFPAPLIIAGDGPVALPPYALPDEDPPAEP